MGDLHFSQGDGEITFCGAIEMAGWIHLRVDLIKGGMAKYGIKNPIFKPSPIVPPYNDYLIFEGISVDESGKQYYLDDQSPTAGLSECHRIPQEVRLFGRAGLHHPRHGAGGGPHRRRRRYSECLRDAWLPTEIFDFDIKSRRGWSDEVPSTARSRFRSPRISDHAGLRICRRRSAARSPISAPWRKAADPQSCPDCGSESPRVMLTAPMLANMDAGRRTAFATNERSAHEPKTPSP